RNASGVLTGAPRDVGGMQLLFCAAASRGAALASAATRSTNHPDLDSEGRGMPNAMEGMNPATPGGVRRGGDRRPARSQRRRWPRPLPCIRDDGLLATVSAPGARAPFVTLGKR